MQILSAGIHHITTMASDPKRNVEFYTKVLGLKFIKKTINFDAPDVYHLYYGDEIGRAGTIMTVFPFPNSARGILGLGQVREVRFAVKSGTLETWQDILHEKKINCTLEHNSHGEKQLRFEDPDGLPLALVESLAGYESEGINIRGFEGITLMAGRIAASRRVLEGLGFTPLDPSRYLTKDLQTIDLDSSQTPLRSRQGAGSVHHIAFRAKNDEEQEALASKMRALGLSVTEQVDRNYFRSIYFREPSGILFEIATDEPGFLVDETLETLGQRLMLPSWLEPHRAAIEEVLPRL